MYLSDLTLAYAHYQSSVIGYQLSVGHWSFSVVIAPLVFPLLTTHFPRSEARSKAIAIARSTKDTRQGGISYHPQQFPNLHNYAKGCFHRLDFWQQSFLNVGAFLEMVKSALAHGMA